MDAFNSHAFNTYIQTVKLNCVELCFTSCRLNYLSGLGGTSFYTVKLGSNYMISVLDASNIRRYLALCLFLGFYFLVSYFAFSMDLMLLNEADQDRREEKKIRENCNWNCLVWKEKSGYFAVQMANNSKLVFPQHLLHLLYHNTIPKAFRFNPGRQLSTTQTFAHSPQVCWGTESER